MTSGGEEWDHVAIVRKLVFGVWHRLPTSIKRSTFVGALRQRIVPLLFPPQAVEDVQGVFPAAVPQHVPQRVIRTIEELDVELRELDRLGAISDDALRTGFEKFRMEIHHIMPADPWSPEYRAKVFDLYEFLHGRPYSPSNEVSSFDLDQHCRRPFPYSTGSASTVGNHLIGIGHVIRTLDLPQESRVLELGPGWGNTTLALAQMGHVVTAVDIEANFVQLIKERASRAGVEIDARQGDFSLINELDPGFDAVLFFECFHHAAAHLDVLASLDRVVKPGGRVLFAAEPIADDFPYPWGLRLDGESLWAIRQNGWLELGFQPGYFKEALARYGWTTTSVNCAETHWGNIFVAQRIKEAVATRCGDRRTAT